MACHYSKNFVKDHVTPRKQRRRTPA